MKTTTKMNHIGEEYKEIQAGQFDPEEIEEAGNSRSEYNIKELTDNVRKFGVLQPIILRPNPDGGYILVAGHRRIRAAIAAGLKTVPGRVLDISEEQAREVQTFENLHREDLNPMDEAAAFKTLLDQGDYNVAALAQRVDKSEAYVYRLINLLSLPEAARDAIRDGKLTPAHGHQLLRVPADKREEATEYALKPDWQEELPTLSDLTEHISNEYGTALDRACFDTAVCANCQHNSANQTMLFDAEGEGTCLQKTCFDAKTEAFDTELAETAAKKFKGMKYLGVKNSSSTYMRGKYMETTGKGTVVVKDELAKKPEIKDAMKKCPEKFAYFVKAGEHKAYAVITDKAFIAELFPSSDGPSQTPEEREAAERQQFIDDRISHAARVAFLKGKGEIPEELITDLLPNWFFGPLEAAVFDGLGIEDWNDKARKELDGKAALKVIWLEKMKPSIDEMKRTGVDIKAIKAEINKTAKADWAAELERRKAAKTKKKANSEDQDGAGDAE